MNYKLMYFNLTTFGEPLRFLFHQCGLEFNDERIPSEKWSRIAPENFSVQLPVLVIDGVSYYQYKTIARKIAKDHDLYGDTEDKGFLIDSTIDTFDDLTKFVGQYYWEQDEEIKKKLRKEVEAKIAITLYDLQEQVVVNGGYLVDGELSWADLFFTAQTEMLSTMLQNKILTGYPDLYRLYRKVRQLPNIRAYLKTRPKLKY